METLWRRFWLAEMLAFVVGTPAWSEEGTRLTVTVTAGGEIRVDPGEGASEEPVPVVGGDFIVRRLLISPDGKELLLLVDDLTHLDWASRIFAFNLETRAIRAMFDSYHDRWSGPRLLQAAWTAAGRREGYAPDNDLTDLFYDQKGILHFTNEDGDTYAAELKDGVLVKLSIVLEYTPSPRPKVEETHVGDERAYRIVCGGR